MDVLFLTHVLPYPLDSGAKVRAYYVLRHLAQRHEVTLASFVRDTDSTEAVDHLRGICRKVEVVPLRRGHAGEAIGLARSFISGRPFSVLRDERGEMHRMLSRLGAEKWPDVIHADQLAMAQYAIRMAETAPAGKRPKLLLDAHNAYYLIPQRLAEATANVAMRWFLRHEAGLLGRYEAGCYSRCDHLLTVTAEDRASIEALRKRHDTAMPACSTIPICVDAGAPALDFEPGACGLLLLGGLHWPPNADGARWFVREVWPRVREQAPEARLFVVGARPPGDLRALGDRVGARSPAEVGDSPVAVTGYVADPRPFIQASVALLAPLRSGGGMRVKIVEAMQWGLPVVSTSIGCEGIQARPREDLLIADTPDHFAVETVRLLREPGLRERLSSAGRRLVERQYDWRQQYSLLDSIYARGSHG